MDQPLKREFLTLRNDFLSSNQSQLKFGLMTFISQADEHSKIWHEWLRHLNFCSIKLMVTQNMVDGLPKVLTLNRVFKGFDLSKHHQAPFNYGNAWQVSNPLELVHGDLCCINKPSLVGARYILTFIDYLSRFIYVYFLKNKSHVFEKFRKFRALDERQCGWLVKCLRSNNCWEYVS